MPKISKILLLVASVALALTVLLGVNTSGVNAATDDQDGAYKQINVYSEVLRHIQTDYVVDPNIPQVTDGALRGLLESLDADSSYLTPEEYKAYKAQAGAARRRWGSMCRSAMGMRRWCRWCRAVLLTRPV